MSDKPNIIFTTKRLAIRSPETGDAELLFNLWTDPEVMINVGFPYGLPISMAEIEDQIAKIERGTPFGRYLIVCLQGSNRPIGECKMTLPDQDGISRTDIKLLPEFWGSHYGVEVKQALVEYLFVHTECKRVEGTPNVNNIASIKMQEAVGAVRVGEQTYHFPHSKAEYTIPVHHYIYYVYRADWEKRRTG